MDWLVSNAPTIAAITGALGGVWTLASKARKSAYGWMTDNFASKSDVARVETKIDTLVELHWQRAHKSREK